MYNYAITLLGPKKIILKIVYWLLWLPTISIKMSGNQTVSGYNKP
ncbi:hypothetical protein LBR04_12050 [Levilactobacillus brevis]|nr:hypothetical protein LBR04_12050 [Levilactobacillus brevis]